MHKSDQNLKTYICKVVVSGIAQGHIAILFLFPRDGSESIRISLLKIQIIYV